MQYIARIQPNPTLFKFVFKVAKSPDSYPLLTALSAAAAMLCAYAVYQFNRRPDFKALRISSNAKENIDKPIGYHSNRVFKIGMRQQDPTPEKVKDIIKSVQSP
ncbi:hypothetical protein BOX15_Mlig028416g1 [Macrostomum lignano]|uniref:Uncharacterized protein n=1 Tax=Macrostomum lignano TaxID=282301 RepID=A0A267H7P3_9PLAT|nr:hypothetical protein BOX15_Mlig028416g1 [Macrostomum lignano]